MIFVDPTKLLLLKQALENSGGTFIFAFFNVVKSVINSI